MTSHHQWARDLLEGRTTTNRWSGNLTAHEDYTVEVRASNRIGNGPWTAVTLILRREPVQLSVTTLTAEDGALKVAWTDGGDDEITGYEVRHTNLTPASPVPDSTDSEYVRGITGTSPLEYTIEGLVNGRRYEVQVRSHNKSSECDRDFSNWSERVAGTPVSAN